MRKLKSWPGMQVISAFRSFPAIFGWCVVWLLLLPVAPVFAQVSLYVASSLVDVMAEVSDEFELETGISVSVVSAGSSALAQQIVGGAPADIFISANREWLGFVQERTDFQAGRALFANRLVVIARKGTDISLTNLEDLPDILKNQRLAIGDPMFVPGGIYARQALTSVHIWSIIKNSLAPSANVRAALRLVLTGAAPLGIVYASDANKTSDTSEARDGTVRVVYRIDPGLHDKILYWGSVRENASEQARQFFEYLLGNKMQEAALKFGFQVLEGNKNS